MKEFERLEPNTIDRKELMT